MEILGDYTTGMQESQDLSKYIKKCFYCNNPQEIAGIYSIPKNHSDHLLCKHEKWEYHKASMPSWKMCRGCALVVDLVSKNTISKNPKGNKYCIYCRIVTGKSPDRHDYKDICKSKICLLKDLKYDIGWNVHYYYISLWSFSVNLIRALKGLLKK